MKYIILTLAALLCLPLFVACISSPTNTDVTTYPSTSIPNQQNTTTDDNINEPPPRPSQLSTSENPFVLGSATPDGGSLHEFLDIFFRCDSQNVLIINQILGLEYLTGSRLLCENFYNSLTREELFELEDIGRNIRIRYAEHLFVYNVVFFEYIQTTELFATIHLFGITYEELMAWTTIHWQAIVPPPEWPSDVPWVNQYSPELIAVMFLPREEMMEFVVQDNGAIFNGVVHNIWTLNYVFENDVDTFVEICLDELIDFQVRLEDMNIFTGFNEDMVEFANANNMRRR